jgi:hypothetical protein
VSPDCLAKALNGAGSMTTGRDDWRGPTFGGATLLYLILDQRKEQSYMKGDGTIGQGLDALCRYGSLATLGSQAGSDAICGFDWLLR